MAIDRPLDFLNELKNSLICVNTKDGKKAEGTLLAFDIHINLVIKEKKGNKFIRGDLINSIEAID